VFCPNCREAVARDSKSCSGCGARIAAPIPRTLHWAGLLLLNILTVGIFANIWCFVQANFARKIDEGSRAMLWYALSIGAELCSLVVATVGGTKTGLTAYLAGGAVILYAVGTWSIKQSIDQYYQNTMRIPSRLSGMMTIVLSQIYLQYHFSRIRTWSSDERPTADHCD